MSNATLRALLAMSLVSIPCLQARADADPATATVATGNLVVPYDGFLSLDGAPMAGTRDLKFDLYQDPTGGTAVWTETQAVTFYNGRFSVGLGAVTPINSTILDAERLYLGVSVDDGAGSFFALSGRQAIEPTPYAAWAANSANFKVAGALTVAGPTVAGDTVTINKVGDGAELLRLNLDDAWAFTQFGGAGWPGLMLKNVGGGDKSFFIQTNGNFQLKNSVGTTKVTLAATGDATFGRNLSATGTSTLNGAVTAGNSLSVATDLSVGGNETTGGSLIVGGDLTVLGKITNLVISGVFSVDYAGTDLSTTLTSLSNSICFLTRVEAEGLNGNDEGTTCEVYEGVTNWRLGAYGKHTNGDSQFTCAARCLSW